MKQLLMDGLIFWLIVLGGFISMAMAPDKADLIRQGLHTYILIHIALDVFHLRKQFADTITTSVVKSE